MKNIKLILFIVLSLVWSYIYFVIRPITSLGNMPYEFGFAVAWLPALGLFLFSSLLGLFSTENPMSLLGNKPMWSLVIFCLPIVTLTSFGVPNEANLNPHYFGLVLGAIVMIYALLEEFGWRGYLQQELKIENEWIKYSIIGLVWYVWHWDFMDSDAQLVGNLIFIVGLIFGSLGIGKLADLTKSLLVCAAVHGLANIGFLYGMITQNVSISNRLIMVGLCGIAFYIIIMRYWVKNVDL